MDATETKALRSLLLTGTGLYRESTSPGLIAAGLVELTTQTWRHDYLGSKDYRATTRVVRITDAGRTAVAGLGFSL